MKHKRVIIGIGLALAMLVNCLLFALPAFAADDNVEYIYFDLAAGDVTISGSSYTGYVYQKDGDTFTTTTISGTFASGKAYYVYQSYGGSTAPDGYFDVATNTYVIPTRTPVTHNDLQWEDYITNNSDVEAVIGAWNTDAPNAGRQSTGNRIAITGKVNTSIVIDNLWSSYTTRSTSKTTGGISFIPNSANSNLTIEAKGDNRFANIFYYNSRTTTTTHLTFEEKEIGSSITVANLKQGDDDNYWCAAIGGNDGGYDAATGLVFNSGTIFAGTNAKDDCTAIGGGGNGYAHITINGGRVTATVTSSGAAIGGGIGKTSTGGPADIYINGGEVYAYNFSCSSGGYSNQGVAYIPAAAIGGGSSARAVCDACTVTITGGRVYAQSVGGTAIGGGSSADNNGGTATVKISGNAYVEAKSISGTINGASVPAGVAIGGGTGGKADSKNGGNVTLTIEGTPTVIVGSIGGGKTTSPTGKIGSANVTIKGGTIQGQIIMAQGSSTNCSLTMSGGTIDNSQHDNNAFPFLEENGGVVYMDDSKGVASISGGAIIGSNATNGGAIYMTAGTATISGTAIIQNCSADENGGAIYMGGGELTMSGGTVSQNNSQNGAGVYLAKGTMTVSGGEISNNAASANGGAAYLGGGELTVSGGEITVNKAVNGAGAYLAAGEMTVSGGSITDNVAKENGGGAYLAGGSLTMSGGEITSNDAIYGAGVYLADGTMTVSGDAQINHNTASANGGGAYLGGGKLTVSGGTMSSNTAENGAGAYLAAGEMTVSGEAQINHNTASANGAGAYLAGGSLTMSGGEISNNTAINGAGAYLANGMMTVSDTAQISNNTASADGGGAYLAAGSFTMLGGTLSDNTAENGAGAYVAGGDVTVSGGTVENNTAAQNGGAFCISNGDYTMTGGTLNNNRATNGNGGAIYISSSIPNTNVIVRSGAITNNFAGTSGGALAVVGQEGEGDKKITLTIILGSDTSHAGRENCHAHVDGVSADEACPILENNVALTSGGAIYLAGSLDAKMDMYCLVEEDNNVGVEGSQTFGVSTSNFMKVEGGTLNITPSKDADNGNVVIDSSVHVTDGQVVITGSSNTTTFTQPITVEVTNPNNFADVRPSEETGNRTILYFENLPDSFSDTTNTYQLIDTAIEYRDDVPYHELRANTYVVKGYVHAGWELMEYNTDTKEYVSRNQTFQAGKECNEAGNLVFFAVWVKITYSIQFEPGATEFHNKMDDPQGFELNQAQELFLNQFVVEGKMFVEWVGTYETIDGTVITLTLKDGESFTWPTENVDTDKLTTIVLVAQWTVCDHKNLEKYETEITTTSATRTCQCLTYTESISIKDVNGVYKEDTAHPVTVTYTSNPPTNGQPAQPIWGDKPSAVLYNGISNGGEKLENSEAAPINAGDYKASIVLDDTHTLEVTVFIDRAKRTQVPDVPQYDVTVDKNGTEDTNDDKNIIKIVNVNDKTGWTLEYLFSWYEGNKLETSLDAEGNWKKWTDEANAPYHEISVAWTNYYVDVRYAQTDNYYASEAIRGDQVIVWTGGVTITIRSDSKNGLTHSRVDPQDKEGANAGILVTLIPVSDGYYIHNVNRTITVAYTNSNDTVSGYDELPDMQVNKASGGEWVIWIYDIKTAADNKEITIDILFSGAEKKVTVNSSATKDEVFGNFDNESVTVSRDSAYTVRFDIANYKHYQDPAITFSTALPTGTTVIMKDIVNSTYWSYKVSAATNHILLNEFVRMGGTEAFGIADNCEAFTLQFAVDFSGVAESNLINVDKLTTSLVATSIPISVTPDLPMADTNVTQINNVPNLPSGEEITLVATPTFILQQTGSGSAQDSLSQSIYYEFASVDANVGASKWSNTCGILVVKPENTADLPADVRLEVQIGNSTKLYSLVNGSFQVALPNAGKETATLTLLSDMLPNEPQTYTFTVQLYASATEVRTTPATSFGTEVNLSYQTTVIDIPFISVKMTGDLPKYQNDKITSLYFEGTVRNISEGCTLRAVLYKKNDNGGYTNTSITLNQGNEEGSSLYLTSGGAFTGELSLTSFGQDMAQHPGSLNLRLDVEVIDESGNVLNSVPLYFILVDTRQ